MRDINEYAKYFLKKGLDENPNTFDGNMKLQKMLFFANLISYAETKSFLFKEDMLAFENGTVIEEVRKRYRNDYCSYKSDADDFNPQFDDNEYNVLNTTIEIFGNLSARELSDLNHQFDFWNIRYENSKFGNGGYNKEKSKITHADIDAEIDKVRSVIDTYKESEYKHYKSELINGIEFYYDPSNVNMDGVLSQIEEFSLEADEESYTIYIEDDEVFIL